MDVKSLTTSSSLSNENAAELFASFRKRVAEKMSAVRSAVDAFSEQDPEAFTAAVDGELGDSAFDTALKEAFERGEIEAELFHGMMFSLLEAASCSRVDDEDGHSFVTTELFALPVSGTIDEILQVTGDFEGLARIASVLTSTGYVSEGVQVILSPTTIDPIAASRLTCALACEMVDAFIPHFEHGYDKQDAEDLFEVIQGGFELLGDQDRDHFSEPGHVTRLIIGATRRIHSLRYPTQGDAFIANFIDENYDDRLHAITDKFLGRLNENAPGSIAYNMPFPITRAAAFSAVTTVVEALNGEAAALNVRRSDFLLEGIAVSRHGPSTAVEGVIDDIVLGPVLVPDVLLQRDRRWFLENLSRLCGELYQRDTMLTAPKRLN